MSTSFHDWLITWVDDRCDEMLRAPRMWGSQEAVELQSLLLIELKTFARQPSFSSEDPRYVLEAYASFLRRRFPRTSASPLHKLLHDKPEAEFVDVLQDFRELMNRAVLDENPFEHNELAIDLTFVHDRTPTVTAVTSYYEEFRRATRAIVSSGKGGRPTKSVEQATDFSIEDIRVTPKNGRPASAMLVLGPPGVGQQDFETARVVREGLANLLTIAEWAGSDAELSSLAMDSVEERTRTAVQALRVVPRRAIQSVRIGGKLIGRAKPIELQAEQEMRFVEVIGAGAAPEDFDVKDEVRAIDLDRGFLRLGKKSKITCYVRPDQLASLAEVGVPARVIGKRYRPPTGASFVLVDRLEPEKEIEE